MLSKFLTTRPWLIVAAVFTAFVAWWVLFIALAVKHAPPAVPLATRPVHADH